jgi:UTP--glucose-1-phosphate uridylyltransferase
VRIVIPAAGRGSRFGIGDGRILKEMLPLGGKPLIHHAIEEAARAGAEEVVIVIAPWKEAIRAYLAQIISPVPIRLAIQEEPAGVGDAVARAGVTPPFGVLLPDDVIITAEPWPSLIARSAEGAAALCVREVPDTERHRFGIATVAAGMVVDLIEKPPPGTISSNLAIFGRYVVNEAVLAAIGGRSGTGEVEITEAFRATCSTPPGVAAVRYEGRIFDCGTPEAYRDAQAGYGDLSA